MYTLSVATVILHDDDDDDDDDNEEAAIPRERIVIKTKGKIILKYKDLITEIQRVWNVKAKAITEIKGVSGTILESLRQYLSNIPGKHEINRLNAELNPICYLLALLGAHHFLHVSRIRVKELQQTATLGTAHKLRDVLM